MPDPKIILKTSVKGFIRYFLQIKGMVLKWEKDKLWGDTPSYTM